jgi:hypothetical protein
VLERWKKGVREDGGGSVSRVLWRYVLAVGEVRNMLIFREIRMNWIEKRGHDGYGYVQGSDALRDADVGGGREGGEAEG